MKNNTNNQIHTLFLGKPELQASVLNVFRRIHSEAFPESAIRKILTESLLDFVRNQAGISLAHH